MRHFFPAKRPGKRLDIFALAGMLVACTSTFASPCSDIRNDRDRLSCFDKADDARTTAARTDVKNLVLALRLYKLDNKQFPTEEQGLDALLTRPTAGPEAKKWVRYLERLPMDPWGREYQYRNPGQHGPVDVFSEGKPYKKSPIGSWQD